MLNKINGGITTPKGFKAAGVVAGLKKNHKEDIALIYSTVPATAAAVFTTNTMAAAPVIVSRQAASKGYAQAFLINSGCANACTGEQGLLDARAMVHMAASLLGLNDEDVFVASTGMIGVPLPMGKVAGGIKQVVAELSETGHEKAMNGIMTTDTFPKVCAYEFLLDGIPVRIAGIAKGAGMIMPNMATTLGFVTTDAAIAPAALKQALQDAIKHSFNMISVDGDTSTNDMVGVLANGQAGNKPISEAAGTAYQEFAAALRTVCTDLAKLVVQDGEGATKFLEITVQGAVSFEDAKKAAMSIANSPLVKTAFFGQDPNWGRILCAAGYSGAKADPAKTSLAIGGVTIVQNGVSTQFDIKTLEQAMEARDITVVLNLAVGEKSATVWTCDFSYEYVKINADYST